MAQENAVEQRDRLHKELAKYSDVVLLNELRSRNPPLTEHQCRSIDATFLAPDLSANPTINEEDAYHMKHIWEKNGPVGFLEQLITTINWVFQDNKADEIRLTFWRVMLPAWRIDIEELVKRLLDEDEEKKR
ncbi:MAG: hypothetical protein IMZ57_04040 [Acidobacteria bacterium]|nr:hypothetical protein [Acidobacteriota bacterium]